MSVINLQNAIFERICDKLLTYKFDFDSHYKIYYNVPKQLIVSNVVFSSAKHPSDAIKNCGLTIVRGVHFITPYRVDEHEGEKIITWVFGCAEYNNNQRVITHLTYAEKVL